MALLYTMHKLQSITRSGEGPSHGVQILATFLAQSMMKSLKLVNIQRLKSNQLVTKHQCYLLCRVHASMPKITNENHKYISTQSTTRSPAVAEGPHEHAVS